MHVNTSRQYFPGWRDVIRRLLAHRPRFVVLTRLLAGEIETFLTRQMLRGHSTACVFLNGREVTELFEQHGYGLVFKGPCAEEQMPPTDFGPGIPTEQRIPCSVNLVFGRSPKKEAALHDRLESTQGEA